MAETEIVFKRTCNYWIDAGIVGFYDTLNKPVSNSEAIGEWPKTVKSYTGIDTSLTPDQLILTGEECNIDRALSYALERIRTTLYDVSTEKQITSPEKDGRIKQMSTLAGEVIASGKQAEYTYFRQKIIKNIGMINTFLPIEHKKTKKLSTCVFCGQPTNTKLALKEANEVFIGQTSKSSPFVEGDSSNRCFHSHHNGSEKCWQCGYVTFFAPLLLFYRKQPGSDDTYYALPYIPGNLSVTHLLYRSLTGKRGLARVSGADHTRINYESDFKIMPRGIPSFTLTFYFDLFERLLPKTAAKLLQTSQNIGLIDDRGSVFQTALFLKRDSGQKSFIMRETTIDRSAYFIKLFTYLKNHLDDENKGKLSDGLHSLIRRAIGKGNQLQRLSVIRASQALTEGRHVYRFLLSILSSDLKEDKVQPYDANQIINLFQKYDQWLFKKEDEFMANMVEQAKNSGWYLSQAFWQKSGWDDEEKKNLIKRYYYGIERSPSPVKFLEQVRHAYKKVEKEIPKEMVFHNKDDVEDIKKFEVYRVYFLIGMLNGLINKQQVSTIPDLAQTNETEDINND
jgi:hypothetical protein